MTNCWFTRGLPELLGINGEEDPYTVRLEDNNTADQREDKKMSPTPNVSGEEGHGVKSEKGFYLEVDDY